MNILTFTTLFPNAAQPYHGLFVEHRLRQLVERHNVKPVVVAPVPWFPLGHPVFGKYADFAKAPKSENRYGIDVLHPRYLVIPKVGMNWAPELLSIGAISTIRELNVSNLPFNLIDAHYLYPDGVAAVRVAKQFRKPVVLTARGSDVNVITKFQTPRKKILDAISAADAVIAVSAALKDRLTALGASHEKIHVLRNGVDLDLFAPNSQVATQKRQVMLSVGNLVPNKGHDIAINSLVSLPEMHLRIAGAGPMESTLRDLVQRLKLEARVEFLGSVSQQELVNYYRSSEFLVLLSENEGMPNVVLESIACGTPVIATDAGGVKEVLSSEAAGVVLRSRSVEGLLDGVRRLRGSMPSCQETRAFAEQYSWESTSRTQYELFGQLIASVKH